MNYVIFNADGSLNKQNFEYYVQQGDNNNQFFVGLSGGLASDSAIGVCVLPNGDTNTISGVWNASYEYAEGETADGWLFSLTTAQTEISGLLQIAIYVNRGSTIKVSYPIGIVINETGVRPDTDTGITIEELNSYLVELQKYALKDHVIYLEDKFSTDTLASIGTGPHFVRVGGVYYFFTISGSGTVDFSAINLSSLKMYYHGSVSDSTTIATALSSTYLDELVDLKSEQTITGKKTLESTGNIVPATSSTYEIGSASKSYSNVYTNSVNSISVSSFENKNNKVVAINASSTDTQYPSAKCVWDVSQNIREVAEGKSSTFVLSYLDTIAIIKAAITSSIRVYNFAGEDISQDVLDGDYDSATFGNANFNSQNASITALIAPYSTYLILRNGKYINAGYTIVSYSDFVDAKIGDIFLVIETDVPDRWYGGSYTFYKMETTKVDLNNYYSKSESLLPTSSGTYNIGGNGAEWDNLFLSGKSNYSDGTNTWYIQAISADHKLKLFNPNGDSVFEIGVNNHFEFKNPVTTRVLYPITDNSQNVGTSSLRYKYVYTYNISDGINSYTVAESFGVIFNKLANGTTVIKWSEFCVFDLSANTTFTFETPKSSSVPEYKAIISNNGGSNITLTFTGVTNILCNDDNCTVTNGTNSTLVLPTGVSIEISVLDNMMVAINFEAQ